jgi:methylated-DNA-protein-cysteine methyltransferase-like protein
MVRQKHRGLGLFERIYDTVRLIPRGKVATYGQIASIVSHRGAARTVGWALRALQEGTGVPWHRVINAQGTISATGREREAEIQRALLEAEGIQFDAQASVDLSGCQWPGLDWPEIEALRQGWNEKSLHS